MKKLSILTAMVLAVGGLTMGCQNQGQQEPAPGAQQQGQEQEGMGMEPVEPGQEERTGFEDQEQQRQQDQQEQQQDGGFMQDAEQQWNENVEQPAQERMNE